ncbi:STAS domain-containing protein [Pedococcus bigeumensis]|jgi:anti-anti-sigma regulatory factor|uniref:STAS domain-containing protein n=1 Tax=Pedococcus bigeumensis TaxID=433644 RepID=UPI002FEDD71D
MTTLESQQHLARATSLRDASLAHDLITLRSTVAEVLRGRTEWVLVDVSGLNRPSSSAVAGLLWAKRSCMRAGVDFGVRGARHGNRDVLRRCGLLSGPDPLDRS